jgi:hypothetical protein
VKARIEEIQAELLEELHRIDAEATTLVARRANVVAELRRCRDAFGGIGSHRIKRVPLPLDIDAIPEGTRPIGGAALREAIAAVVQRADHPLRVNEIHRMLLAWGLNPKGRPSKAISDALRAEVRAGRVLRLLRGLYGARLASSAEVAGDQHGGPHE